MNILIAYGTKLGGTAGIAEQIGVTLRALGNDVDVRRAEDVRSVLAYDAVIVGGALYAFQWHHSARRLVLRHAGALRGREVFFFSSGPLDDSASREDIPPVDEVLGLMKHVGARSHATFGGRLDKDASGIAGAMAKEHAGDWRNPARIAAWARAVNATLHDLSSARPAPEPLESTGPSVALALWGVAAAFMIAAAVAVSPGGAFGGVAIALLAAAPLLAAARMYLTRSPYASIVAVTGDSGLAIASIAMFFHPTAGWLPAACGLLFALFGAGDAIPRLRAWFAIMRRAARAAKQHSDHAGA